MQFPDKLSLVWEIFKGEITILKQMVSILRINRFYLGIKERNKQTKSAMLLKIGQWFLNNKLFLTVYIYSYMCIYVYINIYKTVEVDK